MNPTINYEIPTLNQIYDMLLSQAQKIRVSGFHPDLVVAISRGGLIPARIHSDLLQVASIEVIQIQFYTDIAKTAVQPILKQPLNTPILGKKILVADDISDTGKTLQLAKTHLSHLGAGETKTATLYTKPQTITTPDFCEKETNSWVVFPWDAKETVRKIAAATEGKRAVKGEVAKLVKAGLPMHLAQRFLGEVEVEK